MLDVWGAASSSRSCLRWRTIEDKGSEGLFFGLPHTIFSGLASCILQILNRPLNIVRSTLKNCFKLLGRNPAMLSKLVSMPHDLSLNFRFSFHQLTKSIEIRILIPTSVRGTAEVSTDQSIAFQKELKQKRPCLGLTLLPDSPSPSHQRWPQLWPSENQTPSPDASASALCRVQPSQTGKNPTSASLERQRRERRESQLTLTATLPLRLSSMARSSRAKSRGCSSSALSSSVSSARSTREDAGVGFLGARLEGILSVMCVKTKGPARPRQVKRSNGLTAVGLEKN